MVASPRQQCTTGASFNFLSDATKDGRATRVDSDEPGASKRLTFSANAKPGKGKHQQIQMPGMLRLANFSQCLALRQHPTRTLAPWPALSVRKSMHCLLGSWQEDGSGAAEHVSVSA